MAGIGGIGGVKGGLRHAIGIALLLVTVFLWTASNFLASTIFADDSYSKPYFVTYINTTFFIFPIFPMIAHYLWADRHKTSDTPRPLALRLRDLLDQRAGKWALLRDHEAPSSTSDDDALTIRETGTLALEFCTLWFLANYFSSACLSHTTVASSTILSSTSSIWTLLLGSLFHVERITLRKCLGVLASLSGVALISLLDMSTDSPVDNNSATPQRSAFPDKSPRELATGDAMALISALAYGFYTVFIKRRISHESRTNMPLFFFFVGLFNTLLLWPGLILLHVLDIEPFALPPTSRIFTIVMVNSASSLVSDFCWAYSMLLTSPLVVTVGLSLTIPLSLVGQMVVQGVYAQWGYWVGAAVVVGSFLFINREEKKEEEEGGGLAGGGFERLSGGDRDEGA